ncbi:hypothetical protein C8R45DRAFT_1131346 [Mycena sanguinolenta]|nr:hypothetical protein C8R45DRAFT_1131346 [Mycena sanguinolenta]
MRSKSIASLAAFAAVAVAQVQLEDSAHLYQPDGAIGACGNPIQDSDLVLALPPNHWNNGAFCGITVPVMMAGTIPSVGTPATCKLTNAEAPNNMFNATVQDFCTTCVNGEAD